jgi:hypothetical protein
MTKRTVLVALAGILFIAVSGCSLGSGGTDGVDSIVDPSGTTPVEYGWFTDDGDDATDDGEVTVDPVEDPTSDDGPTLYSGSTGDEECSYLDHDFEVADAQYSKGDEVELVIDAFGGSGQFDWRAQYLPAGLDSEESEDTKQLIISGTLSTIETKNVRIRLRDINCAERGWVDKTFEIKVGLNPDDVEIHSPLSAEVGTIQDCSAPAASLKVEGNVVGDGYFILSADEVNEVDVSGNVDLTPVVTEDENSTGRYQIWSVHTYYNDGDDGVDRFEHKLEGEGVEEIRAKTFTPRESMACTNESALFCSEVTISVKDTSCGVTHHYHVQLNKVCRIAKLADAKLRMRVQYEKDTNKGYCKYTKLKYELGNDEYPGWNTNCGFGGCVITDDSHPILYTSKFYLSKDGDADRIDGRAKVIGPERWKTMHLSSGTMKDMCVEEINKVKFTLYDEHCANKPSLYIKAVELEATYENSDGDEVDYFAGLKADPGVFGVSNVCQDCARTASMDFTSYVTGEDAEGDLLREIWRERHDPDIDDLIDVN